MSTYCVYNNTYLINVPIILYNGNNNFKLNCKLEYRENILHLPNPIILTDEKIILEIDYSYYFISHK